MKQTACRAMLNTGFSAWITNRNRTVPPWNHVFETHYPSKDGIKLRGWIHRPPTATRGTVFIVHSFTTHCGFESYWSLANAISEKHRTVTCAFDLRHHGLSDDAPLTFGQAESWDICATLDQAERHSLPKPFILIGDSLGAMASQRATIQDPRVTAAVFLQSPGWPWDAISKAIGRLPVPWIMALAGATVNGAYGAEMLTSGDIRRYNGHPSHQPKILYIIGTRDKYHDKQQTKAVYDHWYNGAPATWNVWPNSAPHEKKWFVTVEGAVHADRPGVYTIFDWEHFWTVLHQFLNVVLDSSHHANR